MYKKIFTNDKRQSKKLLNQLENNFKNATDIQIASGYIGTSTIEDSETKLLNIAKKGSCKILIGMVYHGGLTAKQFKVSDTLNKKLRSISSNNGVYISREPYHGKIYSITTNDDKYVYIGSSNFSKEGLDSRHEATLLVSDTEAKKETNDFLDYLFNLATTENFDDVELRIIGSKVTKPLISGLLEDYEIDYSEFPDKSKIIGVCDIKLRVDQQPRSSLNLYFDKGRKNSKGKYAPRPWYEVEITATQDEIKTPFYPKSVQIDPDKKSRKGSFVGYFQEKEKYYKIDMVVHADNGKNISSAESSGGRSTLGKLIKGRLEREGLLKEGDVITSDILYSYGNDILKLYKIDDDTYIIDF